MPRIAAALANLWLTLRIYFGFAADLDDAEAGEPLWAPR